MTIKLEQTKGNAEIILISVQGNLDASNYQELITSGKRALEEGAKHLIIDMSDMPFMSSSGLMALHSISLLVRGKEPVDPEFGWEAFSAIDRDRGSEIQKKITLLNPQPQIVRTLEVSGMKEFFEIHTELDSAIESFN